MDEIVTQQWWSFLLRGVVAILFGMVALFLSGFVLAFLLAFFGFFVLINGIITGAMGLGAGQEGAPRWVLLATGILGILIGILALFTPISMMIALAYLIAAWAVVTAVGDLAVAVTRSKDWASRIFLVLTGILGFIFALILVAFPLWAELVLVQVLGIYAIVIGVLGIGYGLTLRKGSTTEGEQPAV
jgi:uncharacterized membrane protein HdeD (DUF308 family)